jgi:glycosyltransferase involved in cell wall biosynthesis
MTIRIAHLCERAFNGGALASLKQIRLGLSIQKPDWKQSVIVACKKDARQAVNPGYFEDDAIYVNYEDINKSLMSFDVVMIHKLMNTNVGRMLSYIPRSSCKAVVVSHTYSVTPSNCLVGRPDLCICVSEFMRNTFQKFNPKTIFITIHNAVSSDWIKNKVSNFGSIRHGVIGRANTLNTIKYSKKFTEWFCTTNFGRPFQMEYLGGGAIIGEARGYESMFNGPNKINFKGNVEEDSVRFSLMSSWEFFLYDINMPEGTSMAVLEAMSLGVPVICSNRPGNNEIVKPGINGYLFSSLSEASSIVSQLISDGSMEKLRESCLLSSSINKQFYNMSLKYVDAINGLFNNKKEEKIQDNNTLKINVQKSKVHHLPSTPSMAKQNNDFIVRGNRKTSFPPAVNTGGASKPEIKNKADVQNKKNINIVPRVLSEKDQERIIKKEKKSLKPIIKNRTSAVKPSACEAFVKDVFDKIEKADKVLTGPKFTILSAGFDKGKYIDDWLNSILAQKYRPLEVVFVDDCSNDDTSANMNNISSSLSNDGIEFKHILNNSKKGCAKSYGIALSAGTGEYYGVLDADDALMPDAVSVVMAKYLSNPNISFIWSQYIRCNHDMTMVNSGISRQVPQRPAKSILDFESHVKRIHCYSHWRTMKRMEGVNSVFECPYSSSVDKFMGYMLEELGRGYFLNIPLYRYRGAVSDGLTATTAQRNNWDKIRADARRRRVKTRKKIFPVIL